MSILSMLLNVAVTATHRGGVRPRTITISKDGIRRELRLYDVVAIAAKVAGVTVPQFRDATACCRVLRAAATVIRKHQREQKKRWLESPFTSLDGVNVLDLRRATCEVVGLAGQHWANIRRPKLGTKTPQTGEAFAALFRETDYHFVLVDNQKDAAAIGFYLARRGLMTMPIVASQHKELAANVAGLPEGEWSEPTVSHG